MVGRKSLPGTEPGFTAHRRIRSFEYKDPGRYNVDVWVDTEWDSDTLYRIGTPAIPTEPASISMPGIRNPGIQSVCVNGNRDEHRYQSSVQVEAGVGSARGGYYCLQIRKGVLLCISLEFAGLLGSHIFGLEAWVNARPSRGGGAFRRKGREIPEEKKTPASKSSVRRLPSW